MGHLKAVFAGLENEFKPQGMISFSVQPCAIAKVWSFLLSQGECLSGVVLYDINTALRHETKELWWKSALC